jgi:hypothetical protein
MSDFSKTQLRKLTGKLDRRHVQSREVEGRTVDYIEGWFAIAQANAIFGFSGWDREMTHFERIYERSRGDVTSCAYVARVRIRVRTGRTTIIREGTGCGSATANTSGEAHDMALKAAETDATKRALATFGNPFGLGLYDKEQNGVTAKKPAGAKSFVLYDPMGAPFAQNLSAEGFCTGLRQLIEAASVPQVLEALARHNKEGVSRLRSEAPALRTAKNVHYADIVDRLIRDRLASSPPAATSGHEDHHAREQSSLAPTPAAPPGSAPPPPPPLPLRPSRIARGARIDKSLLSIGTERRLRDKAHLMFVATQPCVVCGRQPSQAHHLTFCQKRGLSLKVSDEFTVPLCALHHDDLHRSGAEQYWWENQRIAPRPIAEELWRRTRSPSVVGQERPVTSELIAPATAISGTVSENCPNGHTLIG